MPLNGSINRNIQIGLQFASTSFVREVKLASDSLANLEKSATSAQTAVSKISPPGATPGLGGAAPGAAAAAPEGAMSGATAVAARVGSAMTAVGPQISAALTAGLAPLTQIGNVVQTQLNVVGGVIETLAAKIEGSMKMTALRAGLTDLESKIRSAVASAGSATQDSMTRLQRATLALGPAAATAVKGYKGFLTIKSFVGSLVGSTNQAGRSLQKLNGINLATPANGAAKLGRNLATVAPTVNKVATSVKGLGVQIGLALGVVGLAYKATQALMSFFATGIKGATNMNETLNKVNETFGASSKVVTDMADTLGSKFGLVKGPMLDAAASFGLIAEGAGLSRDAAAKMSVEMTQLAVDVTSFYNIPLEESLAKLQSGLVGETKPLRELGIQLSEDAVKAEALRLGLTRGKGELDSMAKTTARASLITKGLATASGDMARTGGDLANQFRKSGGGVTNFAGTVGGMLLPIVKTSVVAFNELLATLVTVFEESKPMLQGWADTVSQVFVTVSDVLASAGDYFTIFKLTTIQNLSNVMAYIEVMPANLGLLATYVATNWREIITDGVNAVATVFQNLGKNLGELAFAVYQFFKDPTGGFKFDWTPLLDGFKGVAAQLPEMIKPPLISMNDEIAKAGERIADRTAARAKARALAPIAGGPRPEALKEKPEPKASEYKGVAAAEIGGAEAGSAIARFLNQGAGNEAKQTADNTKQTAKHTKDMAQAIREIAARGGTEAKGLATFTI